MKTEIKPGLLYEYSEYLAGSVPYLSSAYFSPPDASCRENALDVCRYAFEIFLHWTPQQVEQGINKEIIDELKLTRIIRYINEDPEILAEDNYRLLAHLLYPGEISYNQDAHVIRVYQSVLDKKRPRFPKRYFDGADGRKKACICLRYLIRRELSGQMHSIREMYAFFASPEGAGLIIRNQLGFTLKSSFTSPVVYFHLSLSRDEQSPLWFHYYEFLYLARKKYGKRFPRSVAGIQKEG